MNEKIGACMLSFIAVTATDILNQPSVTFSAPLYIETIVFRPGQCSQATFSRLFCRFFLSFFRGAWCLIHSLSWVKLLSRVIVSLARTNEQRNMTITKCLLYFAGSVKLACQLNLAQRLYVFDCATQPFRAKGLFRPFSLTSSSKPI